MIVLAVVAESCCGSLGTPEHSSSVKIAAAALDGVAVQRRDCERKKLWYACSEWPTSDKALVSLTDIGPVTVKRLAYVRAADVDAVLTRRMVAWTGLI